MRTGHRYRETVHLKTLTIKGFKSFASSTTLHLEPGITAVVGPNGSGKSNVVDALTWVMGEQGAKNLRGGTMADIIFAGAGSRPALGRAEVCLTIDNSDGALQIDYTEVTIARTLFRGGGSEYRINGTPCRLLDVQELLSDTGLGRQMHAVVGQGRLDAVLTATPQERRGFIEEAAGVLKHRRRKERALRKLESMSGDLARLVDLTAELRRQLGPLARQAAVARRARTIQIEVRDASARLLADDVAQTQSLLEAGDADRAALAGRRQCLEEAQRAARAKLSELTAMESTGAQRLERATQVWEELTGAAQSLAALADVAAERARGLVSAPAPAPGADPDELERRAEAAAAQEAARAESLNAARAALSDAMGERADAESALTASESALSDLKARQSHYRETLARAAGRLATARSRHEGAVNAVEQALAAVEEALERESTARDRLDAHRRAEGGDERPEDGQDPAGAEQARAYAAHEQGSRSADAAREAVASAADSRREASSQRARWTARRDALAMSLAAHDGTATLASSGLDGVLGPLAEELSVERGWESAVAALLGECAAATLMTDDASAARALAHARATDAGSVRLAIADSAGLEEDPAGGSDETLPEDPPDTAVRALCLVRPSRSELGALVSRLLEDCWAVPDLRAAQRLRAVRPTAVVATRDGDLLAPGRAGGAGAAGASMLELVAAHQEAEREASAASEAERSAAEELERLRAQERAARDRAASALARLRAADARASRRAQETARLTAAVGSATEETGRARRVLQRAEQEVAQRAGELATAESALDELQAGGGTSAGPGGRSQDWERGIEQARLEREEAAERASAARAAETEARVSLRTAEERERTGRGRADSLRAAARRERTAREEAERAQRRRAESLAVATHVRDQARAAHARAGQWAAEALHERRELESSRTRTLEQTSQVRQEIDSLTLELAQITDAAHRDEIARAEQRTRLEALAERAMNELGLGVDALVEEYGPHMPVPEVAADPDEDCAHDRHDGDRGDGDSDHGGDGRAEDGRGGATGRPYVRSEQEKRLARASRDLARLGKVNPLALEEHAALVQRHQFLAEQLADLRESRADLLRIVEEIDARVLEVFSSAWQDTAEEFAVVFDRLFPGGEGRLVLTDPDDLLSTGIEIEARPAGKKVKRLSLLSGGERSLAAVALLVAIFRARPSPFYVMDEVEAALDDTNLGRLLEIFSELRSSSQLIIVTHQKRTMEVADALYGITMREGVTQAVSQRLSPRPRNDAGQDARA